MPGPIWGLYGGYTYRRIQRMVFNTVFYHRRYSRGRAGQHLARTQGLELQKPEIVNSEFMGGSEIVNSRSGIVNLDFRNCKFIIQVGSEIGNSE